VQENLQILTALVSLSWTTHNTAQTWGSSLSKHEGYLAGHHALPDDEVKTVVKM
jgi:hypothetical protein